MTHVAQLTRTRTEKDKTTIEVAYLLAILPSGSDAPQSLLALCRGHWGIGAIRFVEMSEKLKDDEQGGEKLLDN